MDDDISAPVSQGAVLETTVEKITGLTAREMQDSIAVEEPLEIQLAYGSADSRQTKSISVTMRTPGNDFELAAGFLMTEGVVHDANDIERIAYAAVGKLDGSADATAVRSALPYRPTNNVVRVDLSADVRVSLSTLERNFYTTFSCGICGKASLLALRAVCPPRRGS